MAIDWTSNELTFLARNLERGNVVLFLGAGFSVDAKNAQGHALPLGGALAQLLAEKASLTYNGESLTNVYQAVQPIIGENEIWRFLKETYHATAYADWYSILPRCSWYRIYTINIDDVLQRVYHGVNTQNLETIVCPAQPQERDPHFGGLQCVHLHGHVDHRESGLVFTLSEFAKQTAVPNPWYNQLTVDLFDRPIVFIGTPLQEPMMDHYIALRGIRDDRNEFRPKSFLVNRTISEIDSQALKERNIVSIQATAGEFFESIASSLDIATLSVECVRSTVYPHITFQRDNMLGDPEIERDFDLIVASALPPSPRLPDGSFFLGGEPAWSDIKAGHDAPREICSSLMQNVVEQDAVPHIVVLHGPAGSGKTTTLMRVANDLAEDGQIVFYAKGLERLSLRGLVDLVRKRWEGGSKQRIFVFIDVFSKHLGSIDAIREDLPKLSGLTLVLADRSNRYFHRCQMIAEFQPTEISMPDMADADIESILDRLEQFRFLGVLRGKSREEQVHAFKEVAKKQLLVAMREATSGMGFDAILRDEFQGLHNDAKLAYVICAIAVTKGAPGVYRRHLLPALGQTDFKKARIIDELLRGILIPANHTETLLKPRHGFIAQWITNEIAPAGLKVEALTAFLSQVASDIVPNEIKRRSPAFLAYRGMINAAGLQEMFGGDSDIILGLFQEMKDYYGDDFLFWLQYGIAAIDAGHLDLAENYLNQSLSIWPNSHQTIHHMGVLHLQRALRAQNPAIEIERATEGIRVLREQIWEYGDRDAYPYHAYLIHVSRWYQRAKNLISDKEWDELIAVQKEAQAKYKRDDMILEAVKEVDRAYLMRAVKDDSGEGQ